MYRFQTSLASLLILTVILCCLKQPVPGWAQTVHCDPEFSSLADPDEPLGYRLRGDRCEGIHMIHAIVSPPFVASLTEFIEDYEVTAKDELILEWTAPTAVEVRLRAQGVSPNLYYHMDTVRPSSSSSYHWSTDILAEMNISKHDLGHLGWITASIGGIQRNIYLPLRIRQHKSSVSSQTYQVILMSDRELKEVYMSLAYVNSDGEINQFLLDGKPLDYRYYPAGRKIEFHISDLPTPGIYYVEIHTAIISGGWSREELWFYHAGWAK